ncbi:restriction endonuclease [Lysinibacillus sp. JNUCC 51]|uniref:restriction endonuclease n=1 Tax=Lysinibacillus sp. JNUCC-51 TaxID=2792479 RepID=UPI0019359172|nr:restriction endonuclease [Lysinibacillus sp. JNUCC-51]
MPVLDFLEIAQANKPTGKQDTFELFARDFFKMLGFEILEGPDRGQDGGRDLILLEKRPGIIGNTEVRWMVSCKHKAHSGKSVTDSDEQDISDRLTAHNASGFIGFYSTVISSPLGRKLEALKLRGYEVLIFDNERIETQLLENSKGKDIARRYFIKSFTKWESFQNEPANLFNEYEPLRCKYCEKDLLDRKIIDESIIVFVEDIKFSEENNYEKSKYVDIYFSCKGRCDSVLEHHYLQQNCITKWEDISDIIIPNKYLSWNMAVLNRVRDGEDVYTDEAFSKLKQFILKVSQLVVKNRSEEQTERLRQLASIPSYL